MSNGIDYNYDYEIDYDYGHDRTRVKKDGFPCRGTGEWLHNILMEPDNSAV